ncbi:MAG: hypothetical protein KY469_17495 [Actinobacteria bacterium]|nr:hypothetical protein [Actinomycetota bacterium]
MPARPLTLLTALATLATLVAAAPAAVGPIDDDVTETSGRCDPLDPSHCLYPFPNDHFTDEDEGTDTGRRLALDVRQMPRNIAGDPIRPEPYNRNDGFSPGALIVTRVPGLDTPEAFAATNPVSLLDLGAYTYADQPVVVINADTGERHPIWSELDANPASVEDVTLLIRPAVNFDEGARYIVALRNLRGADGEELAAQDAFAAFRDGTADGARAERFESIFTVLEEAGIEREELYLAWDFTVASERNLAERMLHIRDDAFAQLGDSNLADLEVAGAAPTFVVDEITQSLPCRVEFDVPPVDCDEEELDPRVLRRVEGRVIVPCYLDAPGCVPGSRFAFAGLDDNTPLRIPGNVAAAPFTCNVPAGAAEGKTYRPSLYGHGLLGSGSQVNTWKLYELHDEGLMFCATDWSGMSTEDIANALAILADLNQFPSLADRGQQGMLNFLFLGRAMIHPDGFSSHEAFQVDGDSVIDTSRLYYNGGSQGGIMGGSLTAVAPDFTRAHLGVPAMNYSTLLRRSIDFDTYAVVMYSAYPDELERPLLLSLIQTLWDRAESNGYAHHMTDDPYANTPPHEVYLNVAFGDHQVTNWASDVMARTVGARLRAPAIDPGRHPAGDNAYWGLERIEEYPYVGSAMVVADIGPLRDEDGRTRGTTPPPVDNVPNRDGVDPHGPDASETVYGLASIAAFLSPDGHVIEICGERPCYLDGWEGAWTD